MAALRTHPLARQPRLTGRCQCRRRLLQIQILLLHTRHSSSSGAPPDPSEQGNEVNMPVLQYLLKCSPAMNVLRHVSAGCSGRLFPSGCSLKAPMANAACALRRRCYLLQPLLPLLHRCTALRHRCEPQFRHHMTKMPCSTWYSLKDCIDRPALTKTCRCTYSGQKALAV